MTKKEYNGWTNYETWNVKLWMDNDEGSHRHWTDQAEQLVQRDADDAADKLAELLEAEHDEIVNNLLEGNDNTGDMSSSWVADILKAAMQEVNWSEIAESLVEDAKDALA